jgi:hypothetical protein
VGFILFVIDGIVMESFLDVLDLAVHLGEGLHHLTVSLLLLCAHLFLVICRGSFLFVDVRLVLLRRDLVR